MLPIERSCAEYEQADVPDMTCRQCALCRTAYGQTTLHLTPRTLLLKKRVWVWVAAM